MVSLGAEHGKRKIETSGSHDSFVLDNVNLRLAACSAPAQEKVSLLVTNGRVVTMDAQRHVIEDGAGDFCTEKTGVAKTFHLE